MISKTFTQGNLTVIIRAESEEQANREFLRMHLKGVL